MKYYAVIVFIFSVVLYSYAEQTQNYFLEAVVKPVPVLWLIIHIRPVGVYRKYIMAGLVFSLLGDVALLHFIDKFIPGLVFFLIAHVFYILAFLNRNNKVVVKNMVFFGVVASFLIAFLYPHLGDMKFPVVIYVLVITLMTWRAFEQKNYNTNAVYASAGALLFMMSDFNLAVNKFVNPYQSATVVTIVLYWAAQFLIAKSAIEE
ncbi:MAG: lysoplasmalogenase [Chlorobi bacterium]|nr:lysoplasmalogenase [Chlorobiota bacterium]